MISWANPDERLAQKSFEHYMEEGILAALDGIEEVTSERKVNLSATALVERYWLQLLPIWL